MQKVHLAGLSAAVFAAGLAWAVAAQGGSPIRPGAPPMGSNDFMPPDPAPVATDNPVLIADAKAQAKAAGLAWPARWAPSASPGRTS